MALGLAIDDLCGKGASSRRSVACAAVGNDTVGYIVHKMINSQPRQALFRIFNSDFAHPKESNPSRIYCELLPFSLDLMPL